MIPTQFLLLADVLPEPMLLIDSQATVVAANRSMARILNAEANGLCNRPLADLVTNSPEQLARHLRIWRRSRSPVPTPLRWMGDSCPLNDSKSQAFLLQTDAEHGPRVVLRWIAETRVSGEFEVLNRQLEYQRQTLQKLQHSRDTLAIEREKAFVTLHSIGDAVIATDQKGTVEYLNPIAETLTGWTSAEVAGQPLPKVFKIINEHTREPALDPVDRCLAEGRIVGLANHTALISRDGNEYIIEDSAAPIRDSRGTVLGAVLVFRDVTEDRLAQRQLQYLAHHDALTGLNNRHYFEQELERAVQIARRGSVECAMLYMDMDQFKVVNDTAGHSAGDELLREVAAILSKRVRRADVLSRLGGDEFGILLTDLQGDEAAEVADDLVKEISALQFKRHGMSYDVNISVGIATMDEATTTAAEVLSRADIACYIAKRARGSGFHVYTERDEDDVAALGDMQMLSAIRNSLINDSFTLYFQPIVEIATGRVIFHEALLRMINDDGELVPPGPIITTAERNGLMVDIDCWVVRNAIQQVGRLQREGRVSGMTVNLSGPSLGNESLLNEIVASVEHENVSPALLTFEITETAAISVPRADNARGFMTELKERGFRFALDDFGTGFSSFAYLKFLPVDYIKIDGTFVRDIVVDPVDQAMVRSINQIAHSLGMQTIAEFVESAEIMERLGEFGVNYAQGYYLGRPSSQVS